MQGSTGGAFTPALDARAAAALGSLLASEPAADAACAAVRSGAPAFAAQLADALCGLAERGQARDRSLLQGRDQSQFLLLLLLRRLRPVGQALSRAPGQGARALSAAGMLARSQGSCVINQPRVFPHFMSPHPALRTFSRACRCFRSA